MPKWPIRVKLIAGFGLIVGMMLTLMGGSMFGLHAFHASNLTLTDQLRELGASKDLLLCVVRLEPSHDGGREDERLLAKIIETRKSLKIYCKELKSNAARGNRAGDPRDELEMAWGVDHHLSAILAELDPGSPDSEPLLDGTNIYIQQHPEEARVEGEIVGDHPSIPQRIDWLIRRVMVLPDKLHYDFYRVLDMSKHQYQSSRVIVWISAFTVMGMLCGLAVLFHHWVLYPIRLLHRGVKRVARGQFDYRIDLTTGDEMQALAEAFNNMTERLQETYSDLEQQVQERSRQLVRSERLAGVGFLAAGVAHEINNPLASIAFCSEALESRVAPILDRTEHGDAKVIRSYLRMIQEEAFRCKSITEKLLDFSRCGEIQRERTDLAGLIQGVVEMVRHMGKYRNKQIYFQPREAVIALVDAQEIKQVVLNLVVNALDAMDEGGSLRIDLKYFDGMAVMAFADNGCGMTPDVLENIFEPFFTRRRTGKGTGLGLSITHRIVSQHSGEIQASSLGEGRGSTFTVKLPIRQTSTNSSNQAQILETALA